MNDKIKRIINNKNFRVREILIHKNDEEIGEFDECWYVARDVCEHFKTKTKTTKAVASIKDSEKKLVDITHNNSAWKTWIVSLPGLYMLLISGKNAMDDDTAEKVMCAIINNTPLFN